jgi:hypothetical protein
MMEAVRTSETSDENYFTRQYIPEDNSEHHTRRRENLKSHMIHCHLGLSKCRKLFSQCMLWHHMQILPNWSLEVHITTPTSLVSKFRWIQNILSDFRFSWRQMLKWEFYFIGVIKFLRSLLVKGKFSFLTMGHTTSWWWTRGQCTMGCAADGSGMEGGFSAP